MHSNHHDRMQWALVLVRMDSTVTLPCKVLSIYRPQNHSAAKVQQLCESLPGYTRTLLLGALQHSLFWSREPMGALVFVQRSLASKCPSKRP